MCVFNWRRSGNESANAWVNVYGIRSFAYRIPHPQAAAASRLPRILNPSYYNSLHMAFYSPSISGKRKRQAAAACGWGRPMRYANELIPYIGLCLPKRLHSLFLSEWNETPKYDVIFTDPPTSAIRLCTFCRMNRYMERFSLPHTQPFAAARQISCRIRTYVINLARLHAFPCLLGFHIRGKRKRIAAAACGYGMRYANDLIPYIRLPMRLHSLFLSEWKETPNYDVIFTDSPTSAIRFCAFCRMNRYLEQFSLPHTQPFAAAR